MWLKALKAFELVFDKKPKLDNFNNRMKFQKTIYLLKLIGINFENISFAWYHRGPYSFDIAGMFPSNTSLDSDLTEIEVNKIKKYKAELLKFLRDTRSAELYSSVAFFLYDEQLDDEHIAKEMQLRKPWFKKKEVLTASKEIKEFIDRAKSQRNQIS